MEIVEQLEMKARGGVGGFAVDESADITDMKYAERMILSQDFLKALAKLKVVTTEKVGDKEVIKGGTILIDASELAAEGYDGEINGAAHKFNQEFVALEKPYMSTSYTSDKATVKVIEEKDEAGNVVGTTERKIPDKLRIYRVTEKFEADRYACDASIKVKGTADKKGINNYHEPTTGMRLRVAAWKEQNEKHAKLLDKI